MSSKGSQNKNEQWKTEFRKLIWLPEAANGRYLKKQLLAMIIVLLTARSRHLKFSVSKQFYPNMDIVGEILCPVQSKMSGSTSSW